eukprot:g10796.t1
MRELRDQGTPLRIATTSGNQVSARVLDDATLAQLSPLRAQRGSKEGHATEAASVSIPAAHSPAGKRAAVAGAKLNTVNAKGTVAKLLPTAQGEALSMRLEEFRATAGDLEGKAAPRPSQMGDLPGTFMGANDITRASETGSRRKQQTCADGSGVTVTSSLFPLLEGCLEESHDWRFINNHVEFISATGLIVSLLLEGDSTEYWYALDGDTAVSEDLLLACTSLEPASIVHPSEANWTCASFAGWVDATATTFSVDCGLGLHSCACGQLFYIRDCPSPTPAGGTFCAAGAWVSVTSSEFPELEGCLEETEYYADDGVEYVSATGVIFSSVPDGEETPYWYASYGDPTDPGSMTAACQSVESSEDVHPAEATWKCLVSSAELATGTTFTVECGCDGLADDDVSGFASPTPTTSTSSSPGPVASPDGCAETSVAVTSSEFPQLEGCLIEAEILEGDEMEYVGGDAGLIYADNFVGETETIWYAVYLSETDNLVFACASQEQASVVHPADATWVCDFGTGVGPATPATFGVECGCNVVAVDLGGGVVSPAPASTASPSTTDRDFGDISGTPAPTDFGGDDDTTTTTTPIEEDTDDTDDVGDASPGGMLPTDGVVDLSLSAWSAAAGAGATGAIAAVMTLAMGRW